MLSSASNLVQVFEMLAMSTHEQVLMNFVLSDLLVPYNISEGRPFGLEKKIELAQTSI